MQIHLGNENQRLSSEDDEYWTKLPIYVSLPVQMKACQKSYKSKSNWLKLSAL